MQEACRIATPTPAIVKDCLREWSEDAKLTYGDRALTLLFRDLCPGNSRLEDVLLKVAAINQFYSTHLFYVREMADHIVDVGIDGMLREGDRSVVGEVAQLELPNGKTRCFLSFATKYCSFHRPDSYAVYDVNACAALRHFLDVDGFASCKPSKLRDYVVYHETVETFRRAYGLQGFTLKEVDCYLWQVGRSIRSRG